MGCDAFRGMHPLTFFSFSSASSKTERPPSLSLYPNVEGMVRGGHGGARIMPGKDIWQVSELGQSAFCSAYQVGKTAPLSSSMIMGRGSCTAARLAGHTHTDQPWRPVYRLQPDYRLFLLTNVPRFQGILKSLQLTCPSLTSPETESKHLLNMRFNNPPEHVCLQMLMLALVSNLQ